MGLTSLQVCMDSSDDWLQQEAGMGSSSPSEDILTCSGPLIERKLKPQHEQGVKCPRCDSTRTKFCYYNNYSLSQPRYFCKACRRYWTKGGTLRNIPVGGGCKKNKRVATKASNIDRQSANNSRSSSNSHSPTHHLSFPEMHLSHLENNMHTNFMLENPRPIDFMESNLGEIVGSFRNHEFMGINGGELGMIDMSNGLIAPNFNPYGMTLDDKFNTYIDVKPTTKLLSLECQDQGCSDARKDTYGFLNNLGSWSGMMNSYGASTTNQFF